MSHVSFKASTISRIADCLQAHSIALVKQPAATQHYLLQVAGELRAAVQNVRAANSNQPQPRALTVERAESGITVEWCEANCAFAVYAQGGVPEYFPTQKEAEGFAKELATGVVQNGKNAAETPCN